MNHPVEFGNHPVFPTCLNAKLKEAADSKPQWLDEGSTFNVHPAEDVEHIRTSQHCHACGIQQTRRQNPSVNEKCQYRKKREHLASIRFECFGFSLKKARQRLTLTRFSLEKARQRLTLTRFSLKKARQRLTLTRFSLKKVRQCLMLTRFSLNA